MEQYSKKLEIRWADLDPNFHVLHSKYYDFGAYCRMAFLTEHGITPAVMVENNIGPIIFREECIFKREIKFGDKLEVFLKLSKCNEDASRWSMVHELWTNGDTLAALITIDGAWLDTKIRKLTKPTEVCSAGIKLIPKTDKFNQ
ncbi:MAG: acyl-CoA thioesterase [Chitinophagaceae bacterium]|nr:acyl-CoA thioesterase [Chitinophagaceae bacterium]